MSIDLLVINEMVFVLKRKKKRPATLCDVTKHLRKKSDSLKGIKGQYETAITDQSDLKLSSNNVQMMSYMYLFII